MDSSPVSPRLAFIQLHPIKALDSVHVKEARIGPGGGLEFDRAWALYSADGQWVNGKRTAAIHLIRAGYAPDFSAVTLSIPHGQRLPLAIAALGFAFLGLFLLYPLFNVFGASLLDGDGEHFTFANYVKILGRPFYRGAIVNTLSIGAAATVITTLLAVPHSFSARLRGPAAPAPDAKVQAALRLVAAEQRAERTVLDLAGELGISLRALELGFRRELGTTPHEHLRASRLARVHEELARADARRTTVTAIAGKWGFAHHGRFARELKGGASAQREFAPVPSSSREA